MLFPQIDLEPEGKVYVIIDLSGSSSEGKIKIYADSKMIIKNLEHFSLRFCFLESALKEGSVLFCNLLSGTYAVDQQVWYFLCQPGWYILCVCVQYVCVGDSVGESGSYLQGNPTLLNSESVCGCRKCEDHSV